MFDVLRLQGMGQCCCGGEDYEEISSSLHLKAPTSHTGFFRLKIDESLVGANVLKCGPGPLDSEELVLHVKTTINSGSLSGSFRRTRVVGWHAHQSFLNVLRL